MKKPLVAALALTGMALALAAWNYVGVYGPVSTKLAEDMRNNKLSIWVHRQYWVSPTTIVFDLRGASEEAAALDVARALFQSAEGLQEHRFERVILAHRGEAKLYLQGKYYQDLGQRFKTENPVYLLRTLPENVHKLDGSKAYGTWTGGILGVMGKQMEDLGTMAEDWYLRDMAYRKP